MKVRDQKAARNGGNSASGPAGDHPAQESEREKAWISRNRLYYAVKPFIPRRLRIAARRALVSHQLRNAQGVWPIMPGTERIPDGWKGWPEGKRFAFVLTHDVEGASGLARCSRLARAERQHGFRSAFNFIPEGTYRTPSALREELAGNGFEVGIHDLKHNGRLFESRSRFGRFAVRINRYLNDWNAVGFRSGFMLRESEWLHDLNIEYDLSTFDTDPFEPQPEGGHTIFPFWVPARGADGCQSNGSHHPEEGYVEMPYTLPQDSTLFVFLEERTPDIWLRKLDWIVANGGMVLVNIHPDYLYFDHERPEFGNYPFDLVRQLLDYVATRYAGQYWNPCPRELARWYRGTLQPVATAPLLTGASLPPAPAEKILRNKRAAVVLYSHYPADPRPRRAAEALIGAGVSVDLFCLREEESEPVEENVNGVNVFRLPVTKKRGSKLDYIRQYGSFLLHTFWCLARRGIGGQYDLVHVHNMPDVLVFSALVPRLRGAAVILDLHDPMPELMTSIFNLSNAHPLVKLLGLLERWSIGFAHMAITPNIAFQKLFVSRSCDAEKMRIVMNSPEEEIFADLDKPGLKFEPEAGPGELRLMHHGSIVHRHGVDLLVEAVARVREKVPKVRLDIYGFRTPFLDQVLELAKRLGIDDIVQYHGPRTQIEIAQAIRDCHLGVVPNRYSAFTDINFPTRLFEYIAMGRPVIAPATHGILDYFGPDEIITFKPDDVADLADRILWVDAHRDAVPGLVERGAKVYRQHLWSAEKKYFVNEVSTILRTVNKG
jgi:glycosyltransferase involved in cell wall biosynthesis